MSDELKRCPFCGGEAKAFFCEESGTFDVQCQQCGAIPFIGSRTSEKKTMADVVAAWNARAAVTDEQFSLAVHDGRTWQEARECENVLDHSPCAFECSECGFSVRTVPEGPADWQTPFWRYCPNCGAKVTNEEEVG